MSHTSRLAALVAGFSLALTGLVATPAGAATDDRPARAAVQWLIANGMKTSPNPGLAGDTALAMADIDRTAYAQDIDDIARYVVGQVHDEAQGPQLAKAAVVAQVAGLADAAWLLTRLESKVTGGKLDDTTPYDGVIAQGLAVRALAAGGSNETGDALDFLKKQQCADGGFTAEASDVGCAPGAAEDVDSTALALIALDAADVADDVLTEGRRYLRSQQDAAGSWSSWGTPNANTTGVAASALGESPESRRAATWLRGQQLMDAPGCDLYRGVAPVPDPQGAVVWSLDDLSSARKSGLDTNSVVGAKYATPQAAPALRWSTSSGRALSLTGPKSYVRAGSRITLRVAGVATNESFCLSGLGAGRPGLGKVDPSSMVVSVPAGTRHHTARLTDTVGRQATLRVKALGRKTLNVRVQKAKIRRGGLERITVRGLAPYEKLTVAYRGKVIRKTTANARGTYTTKFRVGKATGKRTVKVAGKFPSIRKGGAVFRVVRR